jgi:hypothetical protein
VPRTTVVSRAFEVLESIDDRSAQAMGDNSSDAMRLAAGPGGAYSPHPMATTRTFLMLAALPGLFAACSSEPAQAPPASGQPMPMPAGQPPPAAESEGPTTPSPSEAPMMMPAATESQTTPVRVEGQAPVATEPSTAAPEPVQEEGAIPASAVGMPPPIGQWISLFNGQDLDDWTIKMAHHELGDNYLETFRVEDGLLRVRYDDYGPFGGEFGHLFYTGFQRVFSYYRLRIEYRIVGLQVAGAPDWAYRNNGVMIHSEPPESMTLDQEFPTSLEVQFLGSDEGEASLARPTGNVCSPGTNIVLDGQLITEHCVLTSSLVLRGEEWVTIEVEVRGNESVTHIVNGQVTVRYTNPQYDPNDANARRLIQSDDLRLFEGAIALQAESHPTDFRKVEIMLLDPAAEAAPPAP